MKTATALFVGLFLVTTVSAQDVRINEVSPEGDWIELYNQSAGTVDVSLYWMCVQFAYTRLDNGSTINGGLPIGIISGSLNIPAGGFLVLSLDIDGTGSDVDLYNNSTFTSATSMEDFMQYNFTGGREGVAQTKGIWTTGESVPLPPAGKTLSYFGPGTGAGAWDSSNPTQGFDNEALPVELANFDARIAERDVLLYWTTASEINNLGFEVQAMLQNDPSFQTVGFVPAGPNGSGIQNYEYVLPDVIAGNHAFRLRQLDIGGAKKYSDIVELSVEVDGTYELTQAYPNPFTDYARFNLTVAREQNVRVELFDMNGRMIRTVYDGVLPAGENRLFKISGENLSSGTYFYRVSGENFATTKSVVLLSSANDVLAPGCW